MAPALGNSSRLLPLCFVESARKCQGMLGTPFVRPRIIPHAGRAASKGVLQSGGYAGSPTRLCAMLPHLRAPRIETIVLRYDIVSRAFLGDLSQSGYAI